MLASYSLQGRELTRTELEQFPLMGAQISAACDAARKRAAAIAGKPRPARAERHKPSGHGGQARPDM